MKRIFDFTIALLGLFFLSPILILFAFIVWIQDFKSPFYLAPRIKKGGKMFLMYKLRSMVVNADKIGGVSTSNFDNRITPIGKVIRKYKIDELLQLINVLKGEMSLVGPRPQTYEGGTALYTSEELKILNVKPGITDFASIVFSDEGEILANSSDPDLAYNQLIRPWKSRLCILYSQKNTFLTDLILIYLTIIGILSRKHALVGVNKLLKKLGASTEVIVAASRSNELSPYPPPGSSQVINKLKTD